MSETMTDSHPVDAANDSTATDTLRPFIQQISLKTMQLGQLVLDLYAQGQLSHNVIEPLCDELLALEKTWSTPPPIQAEETAVPVPESPPPEALPVPPTHCPQCQAAVSPGKKFCTTCGLPLAAMAAPDSPAEANTEAAMNVSAPPTPPVTSNLCPACGTILQPNAVFCTHCGQRLSGQPLAQASPPLGATLPNLQSAADTMPPPPTGPVAQFCQNCGKGLPDDITVCPDCGSTEFDPL